MTAQMILGFRKRPHKAGCKLQVHFESTAPKPKVCTHTGSPLVYLLLNSSLALIFLMSFSEVGFLVKLAPLAYFLYVGWTFWSIGLGKKTAGWTYLIPLVVWDVGLQASMPMLTRAFTPFVVIAASLLLLIANKKPVRQVPAFSVVMCLSVAVNVIHYVQQPNTNEMIDILIYCAAGLLALAIFKRRTRGSSEEFLATAKAIAVSSALFALTSTYYAFDHSLLTLNVLINASQRLGNFGLLSSNTTGYLLGFGGLCSLLILPTVKGFERHVLLFCVFIDVAAILLTKSVSSVVPFFAIALFVLVQRNVTTIVGLRKGGLVLSAIIVAVAIYGAIYYFFSSSENYLSFLDTGRDYTTFTGRTELWTLGIRTLAEAPLLGSPLAHLDQIFPAATIVIGNGRTIPYVLTPHNIILAHALHVGVPLALALLWIICSVIYSRGRGLPLRDGSRVLPIWLLPLFMLVTHMGVDAWNLVSYLPVIMMFFVRPTERRRPVALLTKSLTQKASHNIRFLQCGA